MYRKLTSTQEPRNRLVLFIDNEPIEAEKGETVAGVLLRQVSPVVRTTPVKGSARTPYCMMGVCFDCLAIVDGVASTQTCLTVVKDGMRVERQQGLFEFPPQEQLDPCFASKVLCGVSQTEEKQ